MEPSNQLRRKEQSPSSHAVYMLSGLYGTGRKNGMKTFFQRAKEITANSTNQGEEGKMMRLKQVTEPSFSFKSALERKEQRSRFQAKCKLCQFVGTRGRNGTIPLFQRDRGNYGEFKLERQEKTLGPSWYNRHDATKINQPPK